MKILHIFNVEKGLYFAKLLIECINLSGHFNPSMHDFCIRTREAKEIQNFKNVFFDNNVGSVVHKYIDKYDYIFLHGLTSPDELNELPKQHLNKIIWRTWGGSSGLYPIKRKNIFLYLNDVRRKNKKLKIINKMPFVCGANTIDLIDTRQNAEHFHVFPYPIKDRVFTKNIQSNSGRTLKILVGHSAFKSDKHDAVLSKLQEIASCDIKIIVPLTYGSNEYKEKIINKWKNVFGHKITFLTDQLSFSDYYSLIATTDLFFLIGDRSYALGNIDIALRNGVNIVLSKRGIIRKGFIKENINHYVFEKINLKKDFMSYKTKNNISFYTTLISNYDSDIRQLCLVFDALKERRKQL